MNVETAFHDSTSTIGNRRRRKERTAFTEVVHLPSNPEQPIGLVMRVLTGEGCESLWLSMNEAEATNLAAKLSELAARICPARTAEEIEVMWK